MAAYNLIKQQTKLSEAEANHAIFSSHHSISAIVIAADESLKVGPGRGLWMDGFSKGLLWQASGDKSQGK
jgi:hypothetical protein